VNNARRSLLITANRYPDGLVAFGHLGRVADDLVRVGLLELRYPQKGIGHHIYLLTPAGRAAMTGREETGT
jgi:hypothetical protein